LGCSKSLVGLVVPTGYIFNPDETSIYMTVAALFVAHACAYATTDDIRGRGAHFSGSQRRAGGSVYSARWHADAGADNTRARPGLDSGHGPFTSMFHAMFHALINAIGNGVATFVVARSEGEFGGETLRSIFT
jgi:aerobic C4-dicarboxylate transport protein